MKVLQKLKILIIFINLLHIIINLNMYENIIYTHYKHCRNHNITKLIAPILNFAEYGL